jgi:signal transduction histidine kinase
MRADGTPANRLLRLLEPHDLAELEPAVLVELRARDVVQEPGVPALHAFFPVTAVVSLVSTMEAGASTEIALVGREGMIGIEDVLGPVGSPTSAVVQVPGVAMRVAVASLKAARRATPEIARVLDLYTEAHLIQVAQLAACNRLHSVETRLARWILSLHDRMDGDEFVIPHEFIAEMLGVHRPTVSTALQRLQEQHAILKRGRAIVVGDRRALEALACECHRIIQGTFERVFSRGARGAALARRRPGPVPDQSESEIAASLEAMRDIAGRLLVANIREQEAREAAEAANRAKDQFLAMVSHELRTPLNAILGWCAMLKAPNEQTLDRGLRTIERNARAQLTLVEDLLDAARLTSATLTIEPAVTSLPDVVQSAVDTIQPAADEKGVELHLSFGDEQLPPLFADAGRLRQVVLNVLTNSLKFTEAGGSVDVQVRSGGGRARVMVHDTGRGISPALLPHVFELFQQGSVPGVSPQGLGLGLAISRALVELHGGTIDIESPGENYGTTCTIALPLPAERRDSDIRGTSFNA